MSQTHDHTTSEHTADHPVAGLTNGRPTSAIDAIANDYFDAEIALSPTMATYLGVDVNQDQFDDFSPAGRAAFSTARQAALAQLAEATPVDAVDEVTLSAMKERLGLAEEIHASGWEEASLNVLASPLQEIRDVFDLMPTDTVPQWEVIARRMANVPAALTGYREALTQARDHGRVAPVRQVNACATQCDDLIAADGYFATFVAGAKAGDDELPEALATELATAVESARMAYESMANFLRDELLPHAPLADACGRERYALASRYFLGAEVDLEETYAWGQQELARIDAEMKSIAAQIKPGATVKEAIEALDADPAYRLEGTAALQQWMQGKADEVITQLGGEHFDIAEPIRTIECMIAPTQTGGIYYTGPSDDFSRPGRMWWSVPKGVTTFGTWRELTTVYHEGVPGHHLQVAQAVYNRHLLNKWRRMACWTSGHGEGWALYAERLMGELGYMADPGNRLGMLDGQSLRAARVVIDIGVHCGFPAPEEVGGGEWTYDKAWAFLTAHANEGEASLRFELDRYLGWPGQAPSYKIGERLWMQLRDEVAAREGADFDLKRFHKDALDIGSVGLDTLREAVLG